MDYNTPIATVCCPHCGHDHCEADWTDVGAGLVQTGPFHCLACGAVEIGPYDSTTPTADEKALGWYAPKSPNLPGTISTINGQFVDLETAQMLHLCGLAPKVPFQVVTEDPALLAVLEIQSALAPEKLAA